MYQTGVQISTREGTMLRGKGRSSLTGMSDVSCAKTAEPIEISFGMWTRVGPIGNNVLDGGTRWRHLANTIEPYTCAGDATFLPNYFDKLFLNPYSTP